MIADKLKFQSEKLSSISKRVVIEISVKVIKLIAFMPFERRLQIQVNRTGNIQNRLDSQIFIKLQLISKFYFASAATIEERNQLYQK